MFLIYVVILYNIQNAESFFLQLGLHFKWMLIEVAVISIRVQYENNHMKINALAK